MNILRKIALGAGYLDGYGDHPGTVVLGAFIAIGALAGAEQGGLYGAISGAVLMLIAIGPLYVIGCIGRADDYIKRKEK